MAARTFDVVQSFEVLHLILDDDARAAGAGEPRAPARPGRCAAGDGGDARPDGAASRTTCATAAARSGTARSRRSACAWSLERPMYYWLPAGGPANKYLRYALTRLGPGALYAVDRAALASWRCRNPRRSASIRRMRLLTLQRA